jgi:Rrf2 family protein
LSLQRPDAILADNQTRTACVSLPAFWGAAAMAVGRFFSQRFGYAVHALAYIASKPMGELTTLPELAGWMRTLWPKASEMYLSQVLRHMANGQILLSHRGIAGGYSLARPADKITLRDVFELVEGVWIDKGPQSLAGSSSTEKQCGIARRLSELGLAFLKSLECVSIADLVEDVEVPGKKSRRKRTI